MSKIKSPPDLFDRLKSVLSDAPRDRDFLEDYVEELERHRTEEDIFVRLAFRNARPGGAYSGTDFQIVSVISELYEPLNPDQKVEIRRWWHETVRREAKYFAGLRVRLAKLT